MKTYLKSYAVFLAMLAVTKLVIVPQAKAMKVPYLSDL